MNEYDRGVMAMKQLSLKWLAETLKHSPTDMMAWPKIQNAIEIAAKEALTVKGDKKGGPE